MIGFFFCSLPHLSNLIFLKAVLARGGCMARKSSSKSPTACTALRKPELEKQWRLQTKKQFPCRFRETKVSRFRHIDRSGAAGHVVVDGGGDEEGEDHGDEQASNDGDGERLKHLRAGADGECEREHAGDGGDGRHDDWA